MSGKLTTYIRPSVRTLIETAPDIDRLARLRQGLARVAAAGKMTAEKKTLDRWTLALWNRVGELLVAAPTPEQATYVANVVRRWPKAGAVERELEALLARHVAAMPSPAERWKAQGITIEGVQP